jgi:hypothetical protein
MSNVRLFPHHCFIYLVIFALRLGSRYDHRKQDIFLLCVIRGRDKKQSECRAWILRSLSCFKPLEEESLAMVL